MIQYNKTPALQAIIHLFGEEEAQMFKKSAVDLNSAFYPQHAFYSQCAVCILHSTCILPLAHSLHFTLTGFVFNCAFQKHANYEVQKPTDVCVLRYRQFFSPRRVSPFLSWDDFHARSSFARSTIPREKWGTNRSLSSQWTSWETEVYFNMFKTSWFVIVGFRVVFCFSRSVPCYRNYD